MGRAAAAAAVLAAAAACAVAGVAVGRRVSSRRKWGRVIDVLKELEEGCDTPVGRLKQVVDAVAVEMHAGLASEGGSKLRMLLTFVDNLPSGREKGTFYALDLGGTYFRVLRVQLGGQRSSILSHDVERQPIPEHLMTGRTKVGKEVVACLQEAFTRNGLDVRVAALVNDTVGTLALGHYHDADTVAAVIIGTGTNACYVERTDAIIKCQGLLTTSGGMVVNMEWGNFWSSHLPRTSYDVDLDADSPNPNDQGFEKMISGMYLGEILPLITVRTPLMAAMHEDDSPDLTEVERILRDILEVRDVPLKVRKLAVNVCDVVTRRAARLAAAGIVGILKKIGRDGSGGIVSGRSRPDTRMRRTVVAIEGGLYTNYGMFREYLNEAVVEILGEEVAQHVILRETEDGSGIGAALLAASNSSRNVDTVQML
ncbi:hypothetical protein CDL15_Pgr025358 [Punica granatum]|uniref:Phosphotransferase n=1 Tax=Punica granatum TaxID=22663 RepID=A0A218WAD0_PUNGR|nr:hypothetical protein CDL15_Pgr025358 [Punica granatum]